MATREYHIGFAFTVAIGALPEPPDADGWDGDLTTVARALIGDEPRLDAYCGYRCAWELLSEEGAEGTGLCKVLEVPSSTDAACALLLGLHLPPKTRAALKAIRRDEASFEFIEALEKIITVTPAGVWHHRAQSAQAAD